MLLLRYMDIVAQASDKVMKPLGPLFCSLITVLFFFTEAPDNLPLIAGSAAASGITFGIIIIIVVVLFRRYTKNGKSVLSLSLPNKV